MKAVIGFLTVLLLALAASFWLATPRNWPIPRGTLTAKKVTVDGKTYVMVQGEPMNQLGQMQSINLELDLDHRKLVVRRSIVRWNPLSKVNVNNQWPLLYSLEFLTPGRYSIVYITADGEATAGGFDVP